MQLARAPRRLPLAPRPVAGELISSWLARTAASNGINIEELLRGFSAAHPEALGMIDSLDHALPIAVRLALAQFCRLEPDFIRRLELSQQFPGLSRELFLTYLPGLQIRGRALTGRARYSFCLDCLHDAAAQKATASIQGMWSLALLTHCQNHRRRLRSRCPICGGDDPLLFSHRRPSSFYCRLCAADLSVSSAPDISTPMMNTVITLEETYWAAIHGTAPPGFWFGQMSGISFRLLVEDLAMLFSSRIPSYTHILALNLLNGENMHHYFGVRGAAEVKLSYFSWPWRCAVMFAVASVLAEDGLRQSAGTEHCSGTLFFHLLKAIPQRYWMHVATAARSWPEPLQLRLWSAVKTLEGRDWNSQHSLRFQCSVESLLQVQSPL